MKMIHPPKPPTPQLILKNLHSPIFLTYPAAPLLHHALISDPISLPRQSPPIVEEGPEIPVLGVVEAVAAELVAEFPFVEFHFGWDVDCEEGVAPVTVLVLPV